MSETEMLEKAHDLNRQAIALTLQADELTQRGELTQAAIVLDRAELLGDEAESLIHSVTGCRKTAGVLRLASRAAAAAEHWGCNA